MQELVVADSFRVRVRDGRAEVRGFDRHLVRFGDAVRGTSLEGAAPAFIDEARTRIAEFGEGFPRLEVWRPEERAPFRFDLSLRPLPEIGDAVSLRIASHLRVVNADRKGPNIHAYGVLARRLGAEPLLVDAAGSVLEGGTTSLLWWSDDELRVVDSEWRVPSVTEALVLDIARELDIPARRATVTPENLAAHEVWAVNALHGIRPVTSIDEASTRTPDPDRLQRFRDALDRTWQPVS